MLIPSYGALAALGVLVALIMAQQTARIEGLSPAHLWNLCVLALCAALIGSRIILIAVNWRDLLRHPMWMLGLAMIHHPLLAAAGVALGALAAILYARLQKLPLLRTADALAAPLVVAIAFEQFGALLAGSGFGIDASVPWAIVYSSPLAAHWSGAPLGVPVHPVQAYAGMAYLSLAVLLVGCLRYRRQPGDLAGIALVGSGFVLYVTECWRDWEGRGTFLHGAIDGPQIGAIVLVLLGAWLLRERGRRHRPTGASPLTSHEAQHG